MRICRFYNAISRKPEGFGVGLYELSLAQKRLKNDIFIISKTISSKKIQNFKHKRISFNLIPYIPKFGVINAFIPFGILSFFRLNQLIKHNMVDLLHTHDIDAFYLIKKNPKIPIISTFHVDKQAQMQRISEITSFPGSRIFESTKFKANYTIWKKSKAIICISKQTQNRLTRIYKIPASKIYYIPNGVNTEKFNPNVQSLNLKSSLNIEHNYPTILFVGQIYPLKGLTELIEALSTLRKTYPKLKLLITGAVRDWRYFKEIKNIIHKKNMNKNIKFIGKVPYSLMPRIYRSIDIFVLPSYSEGLPKVLLEAMASRLCVIATAVEGNKDIIRNNETGILIQPKNVPILYQNLLKVTDDTKFREKLALNAWKSVQRYNWDNIAKQIQEVYKKALNV